MRRLLRERIDWRDPAGHEVTEEACRLPRGKRLIPHRPLFAIKVSKPSLPEYCQIVEQGEEKDESLVWGLY
ncbi:hypothetical protein SAMN04487936_10183 [Halobacillus dabanensis]|uniref:Uncharacterized protein n=1 Tax=Halobacillus dabanensis TaxID=240302 RepID=A0A1I3NUS7_HALDA|nr:hypothetical protein SAMN04487936_10183 [Halobacillus dabanensis]